MDEPRGSQMDEQRSNPVAGRRIRFAELARDAIRRAVPESAGPQAHWHLATNVAWVRFPEAGRWTFLGLHRHLDWLSGDAGTAARPCEMDALFPLPGTPERPAPGARVRLGELLGELLGGEDRWWRAGADEAALAERLEWMAIQLRVRGQAYFAHHPVASG